MTSIVFAKHAQHVVLIHFPIALFLTAVAFDYYAQWAKDQGVASAASLNLLLAAVTTVPALATGLAAWAWALEGHDGANTYYLLAWYVGEPVVGVLAPCASDD